jgi:hypothetical protein
MSALTRQERLSAEVSQMREKLSRLERAIQIKQAKLTKQLSTSQKSDAYRHDHRK